MGCGQGAEHDGERKREQHGAERDDERVRERARDLAQDRTVGLDRGAEVAGRGAREAI